MVDAILLTHGPLAQALLRTSETILGEQSRVFAFSTTDRSPSEIYQQLNELLVNEPMPEGVLIMVSLKGGSCWNAAVKIAREQDRVEVVSGVNLSMLLSFLTKRDRYHLTELAKVVVKDGIRGIDRLSL